MFTGASRARSHLYWMEQAMLSEHDMEQFVFVKIAGLMCDAPACWPMADVCSRHESALMLRCDSGPVAGLECTALQATLPGISYASVQLGGAMCPHEPGILSVQGIRGALEQVARCSSAVGAALRSCCDVQGRVAPRCAQT